LCSIDSCDVDAWPTPFFRVLPQKGRLPLPSRRVPCWFFFCNPGLKNCGYVWLVIEPTTLDHSSQSGAYDLLAMATPVNVYLPHSYPIACRYHIAKHLALPRKMKENGVSLFALKLHALSWYFIVHNILSDSKDIPYNTSDRVEETIPKYSLMRCCIFHQDYLLWRGSQWVSSQILWVLVEFPGIKMTIFIWAIKIKVLLYDYYQRCIGIVESHRPSIIVNATQGTLL